MTENKVGKKVLYFPNSGDQLPNGMLSAPGIIVQEFNNGAMFNLVVFVANPNGMPVMNIWSVKSFDSFTSGPPTGTPYFILNE